MGLARLVSLDKGRYVGQNALREESRRGPAREIVGLELEWDAIEAVYEKLSLAPQIPAAASRVAVPVYDGGDWVGKATSTTWSPTLKKMIALATIRSGHNAIGTRLEMEYTVEAVRHRVPASVVKIPFFNPPRKTATPVR
jgi:glycine cleavage system T protein (aminomethyltransferase)